MPFSRVVAPVDVPDEADLTAALAGIGARITARPPAQEPNIEDTLLFGSVEAMERSELRLLTLLVTWFGVHSQWINADRLTRLVVSRPSRRVHALWSALARWKEADRRFSRLAKAYRGPRIAPGLEASDFLIRRHGEDPRFEHGPLRVAQSVLRDRVADVLTPSELAARHRAYRFRVLIGPTYRADMWAALEAEPSTSVSDLARLAYGSFATAWRVKRDHEILSGADHANRLHL